MFFFVCVGIHVPSKDEVVPEKPKRPQYGRKKKPNNKNNQQQQQQQQQETEQVEEEQEEPKSPLPVVEPPPKTGTCITQQNNITFLNFLVKIKKM